MGTAGCIKFDGIEIPVGNRCEAESVVEGTIRANRLLFVKAFKMPQA